MSTHPSIGVAILTLNGAHHLPHCLPPLLQSPLQPRVLVLDSSSNDDTVKYAKEMGAETLVIDRETFNHGTTRELARRHLNTSIVVMVTQDAYAVDEHALGLLIQPLVDGNASVSYGRQLPHIGASYYEAFHRHFNYPEVSHSRTSSDMAKYGKYLYFCSNSFAAYSNTALDTIGGFSPVLFGEDTVAVAKLLHAGHTIAYVAEAQVHHSHHYSLRQELQRHFDIGYARYQQSELLQAKEKDNVRGRAYTARLLQQLWHEHPFKLPYAIMLLASKWIGYRLGQLGRYLPRTFQKALSTHKSYW
jgi:rhamnosyltransferase